MRKALLAGTAILGVLGYAGMVQADVFVNATIDKFKTVTVNETIDVEKDVFIDAFVDNDAEKAAQSLALVNQRNENNEACTNCAEKQDIIADSFNENSGLVTWNQAAGNMNNQANAIAGSVDNFVPGDPGNGNGNGDDPASEATGFAEAQASAEQINGDRDGENGANTVDSVNILFRDARLIASGNGNSGVLFLNQSAGNMNNQVNELSLAVAFADEGVALSEADLGQWTTGNFVGESDGTDNQGNPAGDGINKAATINGSLNGNAGVIGVNQSLGNLANQGNVFSLAGVQPGG
jgi:hypothetical protein